MRKAFVLIIILNVIFQSELCAQTASPALLVEQGDSSKVRILQGFEAFSSPLYRDPQLPALTLVTANEKFALGLGGYLRVTFAQDFAGISQSRDFVPFLIPVPKKGSQRTHFVGDASTSKFFMRFLAQFPSGILNAYVDMDFRGAGNRFQFASAYMAYNGWQIGRHWSIIADLYTFPPSSDFQGPNAFCGTYTTYISYEGKFGQGFSCAVALEMPEYSYPDSLESIINTSQTIPTVPLYLKYENHWGHIRGAVLLRPLRYRNTFDYSRHTVFTWASVLSSRITVLKNTTFYLQGVYGKGISDYIFDLSGNGLDLVRKSFQSGKMLPVPLFGFFVSGKYVFSPKWQASATYSQMRMYRCGISQPTFYRLGQYVVGTLYYYFTPSLHIAMEYNYGQYEYQNLQRGSANRLQATLRYDF